MNFSPFGWYHVRGLIPADWEITTYGIHEKEGRLEWCNRQWHQARFSWQQGKKYRTPDLEKIMAEFHQRYLLKHDKEEAVTFAGIQTCTIGDWLVSYNRPGQPCQAARFLEEEMVLLLWTFPDYTPELISRTATPILMNHDPNTGAVRYWSAFGLSFSLDKAFDLDQASILPADVTLEFEHPNHQQCTLHRWGLPEELLRGQTLETFYWRILGGRKDRVESMEESTFRGMESIAVTFTRTAVHGMDKLYGADWLGKGRIWYNRDEKRLYAYEQAGPRKIDPLVEDDLFPC